MNKIEKCSHNFRMIFQIFLYLVPIYTVIRWIMVYWYTPHGIAVLQKQISYAPMIQFSGFLISMISAAVIMTVFYQLIQLFRSYEQSNIFSIENVSRYRNIGYGLMAYVVVDFFSNMLINFILTLGVKHFKFDYGFSAIPSDFILFATGGIIVLISWIMDEGYQLSKDKAAII